VCGIDHRVRRRRALAELHDRVGPELAEHPLHEPVRSEVSFPEPELPPEPLAEGREPLGHRRGGSRAVAAHLLHPPTPEKTRRRRRPRGPSRPNAARAASPGTRPLRRSRSAFAAPSPQTRASRAPRDRARLLGGSRNESCPYACTSRARNRPTCELPHRSAHTDPGSPSYRITRPQPREEIRTRFRPSQRVRYRGDTQTPCGSAGRSQSQEQAEQRPTQHHSSLPGSFEEMSHSPRAAS